MKKLFFVLLLGLTFNLFSANTALFEDDVGRKDKIEYIQTSDVYTATFQIAEMTSFQSLLFEQNFFKEFIVHQDKDLLGLKAESYLILRPPENIILDKTIQIILYKSKIGSAGGLPS